MRWIGLCLLGCCSLVMAKTVTLATAVWAPYVNEGKQPGYAYELVKAAGKAADFDITIKVYPRWDDALVAAREGKVDGLFPVYPSIKRKQNFVYTAPVLSGPLVLYRRTDSDLAFPTANPQDDWVETFRAMSKHRFGIVKGYVNASAFDENTSMKRSSVASDRENLQQLINKKVDFIFIDKLVALYLLNHEFAEQAKFVEAIDPPVGINQLFVGFSRKVQQHEAMRESFNEGLHKLQTDHVPQRLMMQYLRSFVDPASLQPR